MVFRKSAAAEKPAAIPTEDGHAIIGGRPATPEFYEGVMRQASGLPPRGARMAPVTREVPAGNPLPSLAVARQVVGKELDRLKSHAEDLERSIAARPIYAVSAGNPYLADVQRANAAMAVQHKAQLEWVNGELAALEALDGVAVQLWARDFLATHPGPVR